MSGDSRIIRVFLDQWQELINKIKSRDEPHTMLKGIVIKNYVEEAGVIIEACFGKDSTGIIKDLKNASKLHPSTVRLVIYPSSLVGKMVQVHRRFNREYELAKKREEIKGQLGWSDPDIQFPHEQDEESVKVELSNRVFIVHGHDEAMQAQVARTLTQLKLDPIILHEQPNRGRTIIEKFEEEATDVGFAVVLLSHDDDGRKAGDEDFHPRARQNVVLELGFFFGKLGRGRVVALYNDAEGFELPSDISGVIYIQYDGGGAWRYRLCDELKACGYDISADDL